MRFTQPRSAFQEPCDFLNEITKFLSDSSECEKMKAKLERPRQIIQLAAPCPAPNNAGGCSVLYNHPTYLKLRAVRKGLQATADDDEEPHYIHITGDPGVGKSHYLFFDLLSTMIENVEVQDFKVMLILSKMAFAYSRSSGWFHCRSRNDAETAGIPICLSIASIFPLHHVRRLPSLPQTGSILSTFEKSGAERRFLPSWTLKEVMRAFVKMRKLGFFHYAEGDRRHVTEDSIRAEFKS